MANIIASLDIGNDSFKLLVAQINKTKLNVLHIGECPTKGFKNNEITNNEQFKLTLKELFKIASDSLGLEVKKIVINIPSNNAKFISSEGTTTITNEDKTIKGIDIVRAMQTSIYNKIPKNYEVANIIPMIFKINEQNPITNPINLSAETLTVKDVVGIVPQKNIYPIIKCLEEIGITIVDVTLPTVGDYYQVKNDKLNREVGAIINIGGAKTEISIFNKGVIVNHELVNLGGQNIDNDISFIYKVNRNDAKMLKEKLSLAHYQMAKASETISVINKLGEEIRVNQYELSEIVMSRLQEILSLIKKQINLLTKKEISYIIFTGGITEISDFEVILENIFGKNASIMHLEEIGIRNNKYSTAAGMIKYYNSKLNLRNKDFSIFNKEELSDLSGKHRRVNISDNSIFGKIFGYFFDN